MSFTDQFNLQFDPNTGQALGYNQPIFTGPPAVDPNAAANPPAAQPPAANPLSGQGSAGPLSGTANAGGPWWQQQWVGPTAAALLGGRTLRGSLAGASNAIAQTMPSELKRQALNSWLQAKSAAVPDASGNVDPQRAAVLNAAQTHLYQVDPELAQSVASFAMTPHPKGFQVLPDGRVAITDPYATDAQNAVQIVGGGPGARGTGTAYDLDAANKAYDYQYGTGANRAINAPDPQWWYKNVWPTFGTPQAAPTGRQAADQNQPPQRDISESDIRRFDIASNALVKNYMSNPGYKLVAEGAPYLSRIEAAVQHPGSISDQELLDSVTKLNNAGGQVTDAQVKLVLQGQSWSDVAAVFANKMASTGGVLSPDQRKQLVDVAHAVYAGYQKMYQPVYDEVTRKLKQQGIPEQYWTIPDVNSLSRAAGIAGGSGNAPAIGAIEEGHRFKGGNPGDPNSWEPVQQ